MICHYLFYRFVLKPLLLTHQFKTVPQICPPIKNSSSVETSLSSSAENTDAKNSFSFSDMALSSLGVLPTPVGLIDSLAGFLLLMYLGKKKKNSFYAFSKFFFKILYLLHPFGFVFRLLEFIFFSIFLCQKT